MFRTHLLFASLCLAVPAWAGTDLVDQGRRIYQQGILPDGAPLRAVGAAGVKVMGEKAACVQCHRRSGMGTQLGRPPVLPIIATNLFTKPARNNPSSRPSYDDASLARALRNGIDRYGQPLNSLMPRYALDATAARALIAYLRQLSVAPVPGVQPGALHLATIITDDADPVRQRVVTDAMSAWSRSVTLKGRRISLHLWRLEGDASTWDSQLQAYYLQQPVYAVLSGAGRAQWEPVHAFCEGKALPCLFPIVDLAPSSPEDAYSVHFTSGVPFEARLLANYLDDLPSPPRRVVQLVADAAGEAAATQLAAALEDWTMQTRVWQNGRVEALVEDLGSGDVLIAWLRPPELKALATALPKPPASAQIILSAQLAAPDATELPPAWRQRVAWISARSDPQRLSARRTVGLVPWAKMIGLPLGEEPLLAEIFAATTFFTETLSRMQDHWSRDYLVETLEIAPYARPAGDAFFSLSLAPGQREAAKSGYLLGYAGPDEKQVSRLSPRISP